MRSVLTIFFFFIFCQGVAANADSTANFCLQTFNTYGPIYAGKRSVRFQHQANALKGCDVFALQEVMSDRHLRYLKRGPLRDFTFIEHDHRRGDNIGTGLVTVSAPRVLETSSRLFRAKTGGMIGWGRRQMGINKAFAYSLIEHPASNTPVLVLNLHLHHSQQELRLLQVLEIVDWYLQHYDQFGEYPLFVAGDFNATIDSPELRLLQAALRLNDAWSSINAHGKACTYCRENQHYWGGGDRMIDFVFFGETGKQRISIKKSAVNLQKYRGHTLSDHYGVRAEFQIDSASRRPSFLPEDHHEVRKRTKPLLSLLAESHRILLGRDGRQRAPSAITRLAQRLLDKLRRNLQRKTNASAWQRLLRTSYNY